MPLLSLDNLDHTSNFDADTFIGYVTAPTIVEALEANIAKK
jgi:hypothetical protein